MGKRNPRLIVLGLILIASFATACGAEKNLEQISPQETSTLTISPIELQMNIDNPYQPTVADSSLTRGAAFINELEWIGGSQGGELLFKGSLPSPCAKLRLSIEQSNEENTYTVQLYSVLSPDESCIQVIEDFEIRVGISNIAIGQNFFVVNDEATFKITVE